MKPTTTLRNYMNSGKLIVAPGVYSGLSAKLAKQSGFDVLYASGGAIARDIGYPDIGLVTMTEACVRISEIVRASGLPIIADADTGFGNAINVQRTILEYERIGVAGLHLEDQTFPKRCGHLDDKSLVPLDEMTHKIKVARESATDKDFVIIARTDAIAVEGLEKAIERANAYANAGADMLFVEAPETVEQIEQIAARVKHPKLINMFSGGKTPLVPTERLQELGYTVMIIPSDLQRAAIKAMQNTLIAIQRTGNSAELEKQMVTFKEREEIIETKKYLQVDESYKKTSS